jgi:hypothetical protein
LNTDQGILGFEAGEHSGRSHDNGALTLLGVGDQLKANGGVDLDNIAGDPATGIWLTITSADPSSPANISFSGLTSDGSAGAFKWGADNFRVTDLPFTCGDDNIRYAIYSATGLEGFYVKDCPFTNVKGSVHVPGTPGSENNNITILDTITTLNNTTGHASTHTVHGNNILIKNNVVLAAGVGINNSRAGITSAGDGPNIVIENNTIANMTYNAATTEVLPFAGIMTKTAKRISNNTIYGVVNSNGDNSHGGGIVILGGTVDEMFNNIVTDCSVGINIVSGATVRFSDFNCLFNNTADYAGDASAGANDITPDPLFTDAGSNNFALAAGTPCKYTGKRGYREPKTDMGYEGPFSGDVPVRGRYRYINRGRY